MEENSRLFELYPVLTEVDPTIRAAVLAQAHTLTIPAGTVLFDERQPCQGFSFVLAGAVRVVKSDANGRELPLYRVLPGEACIITSSCLLGQTDYNALGVAQIATELVLLPRAQFEVLLGCQPFRDFIFRLFAERIVDLMQLVEEVAFHKLDRRLASLLLGKGRMLHVTHQQLADELGSVREIVTRLLKGFADQGLVALSREQIEILEPAGLRKIAAA